MELSSLNNDFQTQLKQLTFKTYFHSRAEMLDYESLFSNRRVIVFSVPNVVTSQTFHHFKSVDAEYTNLIRAGIDDVCALSSTELMVSPWAATHSKVIKGLSNLDGKFVQALADHYQITQSFRDLINNWQFITIINNGVPEKLWYVPFKSNMKWVAVKSDMWRYRNLKVNQILEYLKQSVDITA